MRRYPGRNPRGRPHRPVDPWHRLSAGLRGAILGMVALAMAWLINFIAGGYYWYWQNSDIVLYVFFFYWGQLIAYLITGWLAGWQIDETRKREVREIKRSWLAYNYPVQGVLAGLLVGLAAASIYVYAGASFSTTTDVGLLAPSTLLFIIIDVAASITLVVCKACFDG